MRQSEAFDDLGCHEVDPEVSARIKRSLASRVDQVSVQTTVSWNVKSAYSLAESYQDRYASKHRDGKPYLHIDDFEIPVMLKFFEELAPTGYPILKGYEKMDRKDLFYKAFVTALETINDEHNGYHL